MDDLDPIDEASARGRRQALAFDRALRTAELQELEEELERRRTGSRDRGLASELTVLRMERELLLLRERHASIEASRVWRTAQFLRRLVGRAW